jgi:hypothetical protein
MTKLHEILAVESAKEAVAKKLVTESIKTLGKENLFSGQVRRLTMLDTDESYLDGQEHVALTSTVDENLDYVMKPLADYWNVVLQKDQSNQHARADLEIDGKTIVENLPATFLLGMETKLGNLRKLYEAIPTLAPGITWDVDEQERAGVFKARNDVVSFKTEKDMEFKEASPATKEHPAQIAKMERTRNTGTFTLTKWSGLLTPLDKANRLARLDKMLIAVKQARQRANGVKVENAVIGAFILNYINHE